MKARREHRVPLAAAAAGILERLQKRRESEFVFPGGKKGKPLSNMAMLALLKRMGRGELTAHGFRSSFRDRAAERRASGARSPKWRWRIASATRSKPRIAAAIFLPSGGN